MGKNPEPTPEEIEFVFRLLQRGLGDREIQYEIQDTEYPHRGDSRYYRRVRRYWGAAQNVLGQEIRGNQDPLLLEKMREHESLLVQGLRDLHLSPLETTLPSCWSWSTGEPVMGSISRFELFFLDTLACRCLVEHLDIDDPILDSYKECSEPLMEYAMSCRDFYGELLEEAEALDMPLSTERASRIPAVAPGFVDSLYKVAERWILGYDIDHRDHYVHAGSESPSRFPRLLYLGDLLATGAEAQLERAEAAHRRILSGLDEHWMLQEIPEPRRRYEALVRRHNRDLEVKIQQRTFPPWPCTVCAPWGGFSQ